VGEHSPFIQNVCPGFGWYSNDNVVDRKMLGKAHRVKSYRDTGGGIPDEPRGGEPINCSEQRTGSCEGYDGDDVSLQSGTFRCLSRVLSRAPVRRLARNRSLSCSYCGHDANTVAGRPAGSISIAAVAYVAVLMQ
jgi:hypothetical protein